MTMIRSLKVRLAIQAGLVVLGLVPVTLQASRNWLALRFLASELGVLAFLVSCLALILASLFLPTAMAAFTRGATRRIGYHDSALAYYGSQPMKYLPGNFWILPARVLLLRGLGQGVSLSSAALLFEMTTRVLSSSLVGAALVGLGVLVYLVPGGRLAHSGRVSRGQ